MHAFDARCADIQYVLKSCSVEVYKGHRVAFSFFPETGTGVNYAYKKKTQQSSTYELYGIQYTSDKAVDGSHNTDGLKPPYFAHTLDSYWNELFPWWMVDLAQDVTVTGIRIRNRKEWGTISFLL
ncbi:hypothetical protein HPB51_023440 [Rhipicephalus microplus]|uniref:Uncharacterized protein n=1 Tax=Rhipicephalus microplus TaxID=6941 RepID=A0A9J6D7C7_RHIMP|nr:hypothetical protein HPB51_023440 [Rhipicephalus microplus]